MRPGHHPLTEHRAIEHLAVPNTGEDLFVTGESDRQVTVWSFQARKRVNDLSTILDFGGNRLALVCDHRPIVVAGSWTTGIAAYEVATRRLLWHRRDLQNVQIVCDLSKSDGGWVGVGLEGRPYHILNSDSGENESELTNIEKVFASAFAPLYLLVSADRTVHLTGAFRTPSIWKRPMASFGVLHAAFSPTAVAYSEADGLVYCVDIYGTDIWRFHPGADHHILNLAWDAEFQKWRAINWNFQHGGPKVLLDIDEDGRTHAQTTISDSWLSRFFPSSRHLITSGGEVISTDSGKTVWSFGDCATVSHPTV